MPRQDRVVVVHPVAARIALIAAVDQVIASRAFDRAIGPGNAHRHQLGHRTDFAGRNPDQCQAFAVGEGQNRIARPVRADNHVKHIDRTTARIGQPADIQQIAAGIGPCRKHRRGEIADPVLPVAIVEDDQVRLGIGAKVDDVIASTTVYRIGAGAQIDHIIAGPTHHHIVPRTSTQRHPRRCSRCVECIGLGRALHGFYFGKCPRSGTNAIGSGLITAESDGNARRRAGELQGVTIIGRPFAADDRVIARIRRDVERVGIIAARQQVIGGAAGDRVIPRPAVQRD